MCSRNKQGIQMTGPKSFYSRDLACCGGKKENMACATIAPSLWQCARNRQASTDPARGFQWKRLQCRRAPGHLNPCPRHGNPVTISHDPTPVKPSKISLTSCNLAQSPPKGSKETTVHSTGAMSGSPLLSGSCSFIH